MVKVRVSLGSQRSSHWLVGLTSIAAVVMAVQACSSEPEVDRGKSGEAGDANGSGGGNTGGRSGLAFGGVGASTSNGGTNSLTSCESETDCPEGITCKYDVCLPNLGSCETYDDCPGDSYCDPAGLCVPYGVPEDVVNDPSCQRGEAPDGVEPDEQCSWDGSDDANPEFHDIYTTPLVADLNLDDDPQKLQPSIIFTGFDRGEERVGILRVVGGRDCKEQLQLGSADNPNDPDRPAYGAQLAIGDLNGDVGSGGHPEIVGLHRTPGALGSYPPVRPIAWEIVDQTGGKALKTKWKGRVCGGVNDGTAVQFGNAWLEFGPGLWDLDNDGVPEVVYDKFVFDSQGCVLNESIRTAADVQAAVDSLYSPYLYSGSNPSTSSNDKGAISTVADVDGDGDPELVRFDGIYEWKGGNWALESYAASWPNQDLGHVAVADFGNYSTLQGSTVGLPEIVVVSANPAENHRWRPKSTGHVRIMALDGSVLYERDIPDKDCATDSNECFGGHGGPPTASDFDGDGQVEFAAAANVFYTVYDPDCVNAGVPGERPGGKCERTGNPLPPGAQSDGILWAVESKDFSSSQTGSSIFDFDGDGKAEAVYRDEEKLYVFDGTNGTVLFSAAAASGTGSEYPTIADVDGDFATEIVYGNDGSLTILKDPQDLWVSSRPLWSQHAYSVTHIDDMARVRKTSNWTSNWLSDGLNNFRQNTQGELGLLDLADLTVEMQDIGAICNGSVGEQELSARVCNRGTNPVQDGAQVAFFSRPDNEPDAEGTQLCSAETQVLLGVGDCTTVSCSATLKAQQDVFVVVDPAGDIADCHPGNNDGAGAGAFCPTVR